jgi:hypothetical protein
VGARAHSVRARIFVLIFDCVALAGGLAYVGVQLASKGRQAAAVKPAPAEVGDDLGVSPRGDILGAVVRFAGGQRLPAGRYRVEYVDGCLKYSGSQGWSLNAYADGHDGWWLVGETTVDRVVVLPGTVGFIVGAGGFSTFGACVAENRTLPPIEFTFGGGKLGVWLADRPYHDNLSGEDGRNPVWRLIKLPRN